MGRVIYASIVFGYFLFGWLLIFLFFLIVVHLPKNVMSHQSSLTHQTVCCLSVRLRCLVCVQFSFHLSGVPFKVPVFINSQLVFVRTLFLLICGQSMLKWKFESL